MGRGEGEGRVPSLMTAAVEREVSYSYSFFSSLMCRPWGIRLKRECNEVKTGNYVSRKDEGPCRFGFTHDD
jgi:hypothetical protein